MARKGKSGDYTVGYKKPPVGSQFKPGVDNGGRRPKKSRPPPVTLADNFGLQRMDELFASEAYRPIPVIDGGKTIYLPMIQAIMRAIHLQAAKGDRHAQRVVVERLGVIETAQSNLLKSLNDELLNYKIGWKQIIIDELAAGRPEPILVPHPDDILMDPATGEMRVYGPKTGEEKGRYDRIIAHLDDLQEEIEYYRTEWASADNDDDKASASANGPEGATGEALATLPGCS